MFQNNTKWRPALMQGMLLGFVLLGLGCTADPADLAVEVCSDFVVPDEADGLRITLKDAGRNTLHTGVLPLLLCPEDRIRPLPQRVNFRSVSSEVALVEVAVLFEDVIIARTERRVDGFGELRVSLDSRCRSMQCTAGQACIAGECVFTPAGSDRSCLQAEAPEPDVGSDDVSQEPAEEDVDDGDVGEEEEEPAPVEPRYCPPESFL